MSIDCTCSVGMRGGDDFGDDRLDSLPVYDGLIDPFCPIHGGVGDSKPNPVSGLGKENPQ